jgi:hypothetical protein
MDTRFEAQGSLCIDGGKTQDQQGGSEQESIWDTHPPDNTGSTTAGPPLDRRPVGAMARCEG